MPVTPCSVIKHSLHLYQLHKEGELSFLSATTFSLQLNPIPPCFSQYPHLIIFRPLTYSLFVCHALTHFLATPQTSSTNTPTPQAPNRSKDLVNKTNKL
ncbi:hypothetical protein VNO80_16939 [Phaseolus coccineus]|uniref:Uncharacterized protein n=1 Tax=Phaseolus coccineus TaxID=3886 RepID=A0AAN9MN22_PHACN